MKNIETEKQRRIKTLMALIKGEITSKDIEPSFLLEISPEGVNTYSINGREVDEQTFNMKLEGQPALCNFRTIGREDDNAEFYY